MSQIETDEIVPEDELAPVGPIPAAPTEAPIPRRQSRNERQVRRLTEGSLGWGVLRFGLPLVIGMILHTAFNLIDMFMVGRLANATAALAALGICDMIAAVATILSNGISTAAVALISRRAGSGHLTGVRRAAWQSLFFVGVLSIVFGALGLFGSDALIRGVMQAKGEVADIAVDYLQIMLGGCYSIFFLLQLTAILRALGHSKTAASLLIGGNVLNIFLNIFLIYGQGPHPDVFAWAEPLARAVHAPRLEVEGAAWATLIGRTVPVVIGAMLLARRRGGPRFHMVYLRPHWDEIRAILKIGWPSSTQLVLRVGAILVFISLINANYTVVGDPSTLTAYSICLRLETMALFVGMGWGAAASTFVGMNLGADQRARAKHAGWVAAAFNFGLTTLLVVLYLVFAGPIIGFFDDSPAVLAAGKEYLRIVGLSYGFLGVGVVLSQAMTGAGATLASLVLDAIVLLVLIIPAAIVVTETLAMDRVWLWWVIAIGNGVAALTYVGYYARGKFLEKRV